MGWFWQIFGAAIGAVVALCYAATAGTLSIRLAQGIVMALSRSDADTAWALLTGFLTAFLAALITGYLLLIVLSYMLTGLLAAINPNGPSAVAPFLYLLAAAIVVGAAGSDAIAAVRTASSAALAIVLVVVPFALGHAVLVGIGYLFAAIFAPPAGAVRGGESRWRGYLIGLNAVMNAAAAAIVYAILLEPWLGSSASSVALVIGLVLGAINLLATLASTSLISGMGSGGAAVLQLVIETLLGWTNWLMPMSWLVTGLGLPLFILTWFSHCVAALVPGLSIAPWLAAADYSVTRVEYDGPTHTMVLVGGAVGNSALVMTPAGTPDLVRAGGAFNMGCFVFTASGAGDTPTRQHEIGHGLSLATFGAMFHYVGAVDENVFRGGGDPGRAAYSERIAESNITSATIDPATGLAWPRVTVWR